MATGTLEDRVERLERSMKTLLASERDRNCGNWLDAWYGAFRNDPDFDAAMERGAEFRSAQPTAAELADDNVSA